MNNCSLMEKLIQLLAFPSSLLLAVAFLMAVFALHKYVGGSRAVKWLGSKKFSLVLLAAGAVLLAIEGTWSLPIHRSVPFLVYALVLLLSLGLAVLGGIERKAKPGFILNHLGFFLIVFASLFGAPDVSRARLTLHSGKVENVAYSDDGLLLPLPFEISLEEFKIDFYDDGKSPRQFTSYLLIDGERKEASVNNPLTYKGYTLFQNGYDPVSGTYSVLQLVRDPWLPLVYLGMLLLACGSILLLYGKWKARIFIPVVLVLTVLFTIFTVSKINFGTLMPALRSWWFVPHLFIYMVAYSLMALALLIWLLPVKNKEYLSENLVRSSSALLIIGMLVGSVWARQAWGDYWAWDPKENWAAVTWFIALMHLHLKDRKGWKAVVIIVLAFLALQITWYGVNYLPSAVDSMHTYNN